MLIVHFLNYQKEKGNSIQKNNVNLGHLFYEFLVYYGITFDPKTNIVIPTGINNNNMDIYNRSLYATQNDLIIVDPLNSNNNVAKNTRQFNNIRLAFTIATIAAKEECECGCHYETECVQEFMGIEHCVLKRIFNAVKRYSFDGSY